MPTGQDLKNIAVCLLCLASFFACSVYDNKMPSSDAGDETDSNSAQTEETVTGAENDGVGGTRASAGIGGRNSGSGGIISGGAGGSGAASSGQAGSAGVAGSNGTSEGCGDGRASENEKCDIAIAPGNPGACPRNDSDCISNDPCVISKREGEECNAHCATSLPGCKGGDTCCPPECNNSNDSDCSPHCGDGVVQRDKGETCEPAPSTEGAGVLDPNAVCPTSCPDDGDACTIERLSGSAANCNAVCRRTTISRSANGDGCCPSRANANSDDDCKPECGNEVQEANEECDGTSNCGSQCKYVLNEQQQNCVKNYPIFTDGDEACERCMCANCLNEVVACYGGDNATLNAGCAEVAACGIANRCVAPDCYCGFASGLAIALCGVPDAADGPCKKTIEEVAGTTSPTAILADQLDTETAVGRARTILSCRARLCPNVCQK